MRLIFNRLSTVLNYSREASTSSFRIGTLSLLNTKGHVAVNNRSVLWLLLLILGVLSGWRYWLVYSNGSRALEKGNGRSSLVIMDLGMR